MLRTGGPQYGVPQLNPYQQHRPMQYQAQQHPSQMMHQGAPQVAQLPQEHKDVIHDTQFDYYGQFLATASSDRTIGIHVVREGQLQRIATLVGHEGPVWMVSWSHPRFGNALASASYDQKSIIWKEVPHDSRQWRPVHVIDVHHGSVNAVQWAPDGPMVATASSDGTVAVTKYEDGAWHESVKLSNNSNNIAHAMGATCVSFAPHFPHLDSGILLVSGGCDSQVRLWRVRDMGDHNSAQPFDFVELLEGHTDWVRDVAFAPLCACTRYVVIASCGQDKKVIIHRKQWQNVVTSIQNPTLMSREQSEGNGGWERSAVDFSEPVWRLSWSPAGDMLVVTTGDSEVFVLREGADFTQPWIKIPLSEYEAQQHR
ncbi:WD domain [Trypanosoma vivax]|uniref:Uncharacterized protein n=1 Tax=Trypanosoma vivax (strain Y486) TaxID=1055687 RepID=G0U4F5_TRYVY|nr:putative protein transport protein Sec13 [Trypanosoma vivax]KAH8611857.1 WD domain [Trypanosoma vivax]CCC52319.1 putative protein transport protein Sec13 [Trypanosoma vivax Y486]